VNTWRILSDSVAGTSHVSRGAPCQDAHVTTVANTAAGPVLITVVADGAGSARYGEVGATLACATVCELAIRELAAVGQVTREHALGWVRAAREEIRAEAGRRAARPRDLACTLLVAVVGEQEAAFAQIGDGAAVTDEGEGFAPVFWPEPAEYANVTDFLTDEGIEDRVAFEILGRPIHQVAVFTDGLQRLALDYSTRRGHPGFFRPLFATLVASAPTPELSQSFRAFLESAQVNSRTDDDKTLVLAVRTAQAPPSPC
jgi:hypothetical protein